MVKRWSSGCEATESEPAALTDEKGRQMTYCGGLADRENALKAERWKSCACPACMSRREEAGLPVAVDAFKCDQ